MQERCPGGVLQDIDEISGVVVVDDELAQGHASQGSEIDRNGCSGNGLSGFLVVSACDRGRRRSSERLRDFTFYEGKGARGCSFVSHWIRRLSSGLETRGIAVPHRIRRGV